MNPFIENISFLPNQLRAIVQIFVNKRWHICHVTPLTADLELAFHQKYRPLESVSKEIEIHFRPNVLKIVLDSHSSEW